MDGIFGIFIVIGILVYFFAKGSESGSKSTSYTYSKAPSSPSNSSSLADTSAGYKTSYRTTGEFVRSTEGFIPVDKCECGGQWVKHVNKKTGGRFFGCSRFPSCDNTRDKQQAKKFCSNGHPRTGLTTEYNTDGSRRCLICKPLSNEPPSDSFRRTNSGATTSRAGSNDTNLYCRNGHERTTENTYVRPNGERECGICRKNARK